MFCTYKPILVICFEKLSIDIAWACQNFHSLARYNCTIRYNYKLLLVKLRKRVSWVPRQLVISYPCVQRQVRQLKEPLFISSKYWTTTKIIILVVVSSYFRAPNKRRWKSMCVENSNSFKRHCHRLSFTRTNSH